MHIQFSHENKALSSFIRRFFFLYHNLMNIIKKLISKLNDKSMYFSIIF